MASHPASTPSTASHGTRSAVLDPVERWLLAWVGGGTWVALGGYVLSLAGALASFPGWAAVLASGLALVFAAKRRRGGWNSLPRAVMTKVHRHGWRGFFS